MADDTEDRIHGAMVRAAKPVEYQRLLTSLRVAVLLMLPLVLRVAVLAWHRRPR